MKIGIITFHFVSNQGAVLQCLATQKFLQRHGHEAYVIDYRPSYHTVRYADQKNPWLYTKWYFKKFKGKKTAVRLLLTVGSLKRCISGNIRHTDADVMQAFESFVEDKLYLTRRYLSLKELREDPPNMDAYVTGSDQLWNPDILDQKLDPAYFLAFGNDVPKVAYAVSLGRKLHGREVQELKALSGNLTAVSLREYDREAVEIMDRDVHICLDPTLLLDAEDYAPCESDIKEEEPYLFVYGFEDTSEIHKAVEIARHKLKCNVVNGSPHRIKLTGDVENVRAYAPGQFLSYIKGAECVVTNSFHGTAFSIIYKKAFTTVPHSTRGQRMTELLGKLGLRQCLWGDESFDFDRSIDWDAAYRKLYYLRQFSANFLLMAVEGKKDCEIPHAEGEYLKN